MCCGVRTVPEDKVKFPSFTLIGAAVVGVAVGVEVGRTDTGGGTFNMLFGVKEGAIKVGVVTVAVAMVA